jgi:hypothetical protein
MLTLPPPISDAERAVHAYKGELLIRVMAHILKLALAQPYVFAGDVPEDIVAGEHRQGVASNAWNALRALEIIEVLPLNFNDPSREIFAGRKQNKNEGAKGRWCGVYRLKSRSAAFSWAKANKVQLLRDFSTPEINSKQLNLC